MSFSYDAFYLRGTLEPSLPEVWGEDAHVYRPERFLDGSLKDNPHTVGVWSNL